MCALPELMISAARVIGEDLEAGADDERHEKQVEEMLQTHPRRQCRRELRREAGAWMAADELLNGRHRTELLRHRDRGQQQHEADRDQPYEIEPPVCTDS